MVLRNALKAQSERRLADTYKTPTLSCKDQLAGDIKHKVERYEMFNDL